MSATKAVLVLLLGTLSCAGEPAPSSWPVLDGCADCHRREAEEFVAERVHRGLPGGCMGCHGDHALGAGEGAVELHARCEDCHGGALARFALPFRHPLGAGLDCTSCHPPHGLAPREQRAHLRRAVCVECHREYAGPFQFEHEGNRALGCMSCHEAHGSSNRRLLAHADSRMLCMSCHSDLEQSHRQNPGSIFRECLHCHTEVHGSQWSRELVR